MQILDEGIRRRDSILARVTRLQARANRALVTGKVADAELALEDAQVAVVSSLDLGLAWTSLMRPDVLDSIFGELTGGLEGLPWRV